MNYTSPLDFFTGNSVHIFCQNHDQLEVEGGKCATKIRFFILLFECISGETGKKMFKSVLKNLSPYVPNFSRGKSPQFSREGDVPPPVLQRGTFTDSLKENRDDERMKRW